MKRLLFLFAIGAVCAGLLRALAFEGIYIASGSMEPTLPVGTHALLDKLTYRFRAPRRGEVIAFTEPVPPHEEMVKRVIAVPGDTLELRRKKVILNGEELDEPFIQHTRPGETLRGDSFGPLEIPPLHCLVLGDNRDESNDASVWKDPDTGEPVRLLGFSRIRGIVRGFY